MVKVKVFYSFDIKDRRTDLLDDHEKKTFEIDVEDVRTIDTAVIKAKINQMAKDKCKRPWQFVSHANYYRLWNLDKDELI